VITTLSACLGTHDGSLVCLKIPEETTYNQLFFCIKFSDRYTLPAGE